MKIGVNGRFYGVPVWGVQRFAREVCARLSSPATDLALLVPSGVFPSPRSPEGTLVRGRLPGHLWEQVELPWRARRAGCDVVLHVSGTAPSWGGPNVVMVHDVFPLTNPEWFTRSFGLWYRAAVGGGARRARFVLVPSAWARDQVATELGIPEERIRVVGQGVAPFGAPASPDEVQRVRHRFGLPEGYILAVGGEDRRKNLSFLLQVLDRWQSSRRDAPPLVVVGAHRARVHGSRGRIEPSSGQADVTRLGYVEDADLRALYSGARVFCFPSLAEGFGRPPLEAMACGTPAVVADYGPAREVLGDAALILPLQTDAWVRGLAGLVEAGPRRDEQVRRGLCEAARWSWDDAAAAVLEACRTAASTPRARNGRGP